jgi:hypothetical protein
MLKERLRAAADQFEAMAWPDPNRRSRCMTWPSKLQHFYERAPMPTNRRESSRWASSEPPRPSGHGHLLNVPAL